MAATVFVQPLDLVKNRMQLSGKTMIAITQRLNLLISMYICSIFHFGRGYFLYFR